MTVQPVFGNDSDSDSAPSSQEDSGEEATAPAPECQELRVLTWNTNANLECPFLKKEGEQTDALCLQEVSQASAELLHHTFGADFHVVTPEVCGAAYDQDNIGTAVLARKTLFTRGGQGDQASFADAAVPDDRASEVARQPKNPPRGNGAPGVLRRGQDLP